MRIAWSPSSSNQPEITCGRIVDGTGSTWLLLLRSLERHNSEQKPSGLLCDSCDTSEAAATCSVGRASFPRTKLKRGNLCVFLSLPRISQRKFMFPSGDAGGAAGKEREREREERVNQQWPFVSGPRLSG